jgi:hypothetical protein
MGKQPAADKSPTSPSSDNLTARGTLSRQLGLGSAVAAVAGESIAVGIFLTPAGMGRSLGLPFYRRLHFRAEPPAVRDPHD